jgi:GntR family transcriptional repressor for pyruvate dehydrogenase complex
VHTEQISVQQIYDVRRTIESRIVALAAIRRTEAEAEAVVALARAMRDEAGEPDRLMERDLGFHQALAAACRNPVFALLVGAFQGVTRRTWPIGWRSRTSAASRERMLATHEEIAEAVAAGDPGRAAEAMSRHFDESVRALVDAGVA